MIVLDGLDHVWRELDHNITELSDLFKNLFPIPSNIVLLIGTQSLSESQLPYGFLKNAPTDTWLTLPHFGRDTVGRWVDYHLNHPPPSRQVREECHPQEIVDIVDAFLEISNGHPLHLRYSLQNLYEQELAITQKNVLALPVCPHENITSYYNNLWLAISDASRSSLILLTLADFAWPTGSIPDVLVLAEFSREVAQTEWSAVRHLLVSSELGWKPVHGSLKVFVSETNEYSERKSRLLEAMLSWLSNHAPEYLRWAYLWIVQAKQGNPENLIKGATREWAIDSFAKGYSDWNVRRIVELSSKHAFLSDDFKSFAERGLLCDYLAPDYLGVHDEAFSRALEAQLILREDDHLIMLIDYNLDTYGAEELPYIAYYANEYGNEEIVLKCKGIMYDMISTNHNHTDKKSLLMPLTEVICIYDCDAKNIAEHIINNRTFKDLPISYVKALRKLGYSNVIGDLVNENLTEDEKNTLIDDGILSALENDTAWAIFNYGNSNLYHILSYLVNGTVPDINDIIAVDTSIFSVKEYQLYEFGPQLDDFFYNSYFYLLLTNMLGMVDKRDELFSSAKSKKWIKYALYRIDILAKTLADRLGQREDTGVAWYYEQLSELEPPDFSIDREGFEYGKSFRKVFLRIVLDSMLISTTVGTRLTISDQDLIELTNSPHSFITDILVLLQDRRLTWLSERALDWLYENRDQFCATDVEFASTDGAYNYATISSVFAINGKTEYASSALRSFIDFCIVHGHRKDILIHDILESLEENRNTLDAQFIRSTLVELAPVLDSIDEYTDGKETRHFPLNYGSSLRRLYPELVAPYYLYFIEGEEYYRAERHFLNILEMADFSDPIYAAIGCTCVDEDSWNWLRERASSGDTAAAHIMEQLEEYYGVRVSKKSDEELQEKRSSSASKSPPDPANFPPLKLNEYFQACSDADIYNDADRLKPWVSHWETQIDPEQIIEAIDNYSKTKSYFKPGFIRYDLEVRKYGRKQALPIFIECCKEEQILSSWNTRLEEILNVLDIIKNHYNNNWRDILRELVYHMPYYYRYFGIHREIRYIVGFLCKMNQSRSASDFISGVMITLHGLVSPFKLPPSVWIIDPVQGDNTALSVLFSRLIAPSGMVRERAVVEIAKLLGDEQQNGTVINFFISWFSEQDMETRVATGLFTLLVAKEKYGAQLPDYDALVAAIQYHSVLSDYLLFELYGQKTRLASIEHDDSTVMRFSPPKSWERHYPIVPGFIRGHLRHMMKNIPTDLFQRWAYETNKVVERTDVDFSASSHYGRKDSEHIVSFEIKINESAISGYLRLLTWLRTSKQIDDETARNFAIETLPTDLSLISLEPRRSPAWWPSVDKDSGVIVDTLPGDISRTLDELKLETKQGYLGYAKGRLGEKSGTIFQVTIMGALQWCTDSDRISDEAIFGAMERYGLQRPTVGDCRFAGSYDDSISPKGLLQLGGWSLLPISAELWPNTSPRWQAWRLDDRIRGLHPQLAESTVQIDVQQDQIIYKVEDSALAQWYDWTEGLEDKQIADMPFRHGSVLTLNRDVIDKFVEQHHAKLCWICELKWFTREHSYENPKIESVYFIVGATQIISTSNPDHLFS
ncbi:hypothetical protein BMS3Bbin04_00059 [bacterium BMS3Bbin04]|nr:hypothetical protein BMS3Bbin04_00059 [bacterium BMS3Bbin04]